MSTDTRDGRYGLSPKEQGRNIAAPVLNYLPPQPRSYHAGIALIGCGGISEYHLRAYAAMGLNVVALCDRHRERAEQRRDEFFPTAQVCIDPQSLFSRRDVEVVDVAVHPAERSALIEAALLAGKHVLSQKPFVLDLDEGERLAALAEAQGCKLAVNQNGRWAPHFSYLAAAVDAGIIGEVATIDCTLQWDHLWTAGTPFDQVRHLVLFDFGVHWFDFVTRIMGSREPQRVWASVRTRQGQRMQPPILAHAAIDYEGAQVRLSFNGHVQIGQEDRTVVCGSRGTLRSFGPSLSEQTIIVHTADGTATPALAGTWFTHGFQGAMGELLCAIEENREPGHSARNNLRSLALCFAALASADSGRPQIPGNVRRV